MSETIRQQYENVKKDIEAYEGSLKTLALQTIKARQEDVKNQLGVVADLGIPIKHKDDIPKTFAVPAIRKKLFKRPEVNRTAAQPHPTLSIELYDEILQTIYDFGKVMERLPSTYRDKNEEALRDHHILQLEPRFEATATGETFNKLGKTDILVRYEKANVFIAECKFWSGQKGFKDTIDQLTKYLTWRDTKTAIICFVRNKEISSVLKEISKAASEHPNFVQALDQRDQSWFSYKFHFNDDVESLFDLAVLVFHLP